MNSPVISPKVAAGNILLIRPMRWASAASMDSPVKSNSSARLRQTRDGKSAAATGGKTPTLIFGLAENGPIRGQDHIANHGEFTATAERHSVDQRDAGYILRMEQADHAMKLLQHFPDLVGSVVRDGDSGGERFPQVGDDDNVCIARGLHPGNGVRRLQGRLILRGCPAGDILLHFSRAHTLQLCPACEAGLLQRRTN